jgi:uncharacterized membrane protein
MDRNMTHLANDEHEKSELNNLVGQNIETIIEHQLRSEQGLDQHQRTIETITKNVGRPRFLYLILLVVALWVGVDGLLALFGVASFDPAPFYWLQGLIGLSALLVTTIGAEGHEGDCINRGVASRSPLGAESH